jgi:hypothetical protein
MDRMNVVIRYQALNILANDQQLGANFFTALSNDHLVHGRGKIGYIQRLTIL